MHIENLRADDIVFSPEVSRLTGKELVLQRIRDAYESNRFLRFHSNAANWYFIFELHAIDSDGILFLYVSAFGNLESDKFTITNIKKAASEDIERYKTRRGRS